MKYLGVDVGTGGSRAVLISADGGAIASATTEHTAFASPQIGWAEQDARDWWQASASAVRGVMSETGTRADEIVCVGLSGQMHGAVFLDEADEPLRPSIIWCDQRTEKQCDAIRQVVGAQKLIELVSNPALPNFTLTKILWLRENEPKVWSQTRCVLLPKDYVRLCLTGDKATDVSDASGTLMLDVKNRKWSSAMLDAFEVRDSLLPKLYESQEITGVVSPKGAAETGLIAGTPVVAGAGDNAAGAVGMGIVSVGAVSATIGTSGVVFAVTDSPSIDAKGRIHTFCHAIPNRWHVTGVTQAAGLSLRWFRENFASGKSYDELIDEAASISPGAEGLLWTPYLMGERTPHIDPQARASLVGLTASHTRAHVVLAILEGVAFSLRDAIEIFRELKIPIETIRLGGGGARSPLWRQIQADVYAQSVETIAADEGAAFGAALLAAVGVGRWPTVEEACTTSIRAAERVEPNADSAEALNRGYEKYRLLYPALRFTSG